MLSRNFLKFVGAFLVIILTVGGGFFVWDKYLSPQAKLNRETQANYQKYLDWEEQYKKAMREDTYGGKTPQETLNMFVVALRAGDVELASKYFMLNTGGKIDEKWINGLKKTKEEGKLLEVTDLLSKALPAGSSMKGYFGFEIRDNAGNLLNDINLELNEYSGIWKIRSL